MDKHVRVAAVDLGASHGRVIRGVFDGETLAMEVISDFDNRPVELSGSYYWNHLAMAKNVLEGLEKAGEIASIGVDAWGHDFIPVTGRGDPLGAMYSYRDPRTDRMAAYVRERLKEADAYALTGEAVNPIATRVQLCALMREQPEIYAAANGILFVADYINYLLCGERRCNETQVSMGGLLDLQTRGWCRTVCEKLGLRDDWGRIVRVGETVGKRSDGARVIAVAAHDTASALSFLPGYTDRNLLVSSGTWALVGVKTGAPVMDARALHGDLQVELGANSELLQINNLTGMWIMQELAREWGGVNFDALNLEAARSDYNETVDTQDASLSAPGDMARKLTTLTRIKGVKTPKTQADFYRLVLLSLCKRFTDTIQTLEALYGVSYEAINVVGGGARNRYFNQLIADQTGKKVIAGPYEATAIGSMLEQLLALGVLSSREEAARVLERSFPPEIYTPGI